MKCKKALLLALLLLPAGLLRGESGKALPKSDIEYLTGVYKATFDGIIFFVNDKTGLPYDVSDFRKATSTSNIGLYMASIAVGSKTGLISKEDALRKLDLALTSLEKIQKWNGFPVTWVNVDTLQRDFGPSFSYADHVGNLVCGLLVVEGIFPKEFGKRIDAYVKPMQFLTAYDPATGWLKGGYNIEKKDFDINQPWGKWYYNIFAADTRPFSLIGITLKQIPETHWDKLNRSTDAGSAVDTELKGGGSAVYYWPGIEGGGMFMQFLPGIFLPETGLAMGESAKNFAGAQLEYSKKKGYYPLWGVSASEAPDGKSYLGWGGMRLDVITPHASVLAIGYYPSEAVENLKELESRGMRPVYESGGKKYDFGFTDSYDIHSSTCSKNYLLLDQGMLFLSLANYLDKDVVRESFGASPLGKKSVKTLEKLENKRFLK